MLLVPRTLPLESNETIRAEIYEKVLNPIFSVTSEDSDRAQLRDFWLQKAARAIAGEYLDKIWIVMEGLRDCGNKRTKGGFTEPSHPLQPRKHTRHRLSPPTSPYG